MEQLPTLRARRGWLQPWLSAPPALQLWQRGGGGAGVAAAGAAAGVAAAVEHSALRKSLHLSLLPASCAALYFALHSFSVRALAEVAKRQIAAIMVRRAIMVRS